MKIDKSNPKHWLLLSQQALFMLIATCLRPFRRRNPKPTIVLYGHQLSGNLKALYEQWEHTHRHKLDLYFLSLDPEYSQVLAKTNVQLLRCSSLKDMLFVGRCDAIITDHGLHLMSPLVNLTDIRFIDVWHGIPFKGFVPDDFRLQHKYDEVWVSSKRLAQLYKDQFGFKEKQLKCLGYARTDRLFNAATGQNPEKAEQALPPARYVLYAPTWQQDEKGRELFPFGESSESFISTIADSCAEQGATLLVRSHMNSEISHVSHPNVKFCSQRDYPDTEAVLLQTDILICDWSSIAFDYLALQRPTLFLEVPPPFRNGFSLDGSYRAGEIVMDMDQLCSSLAIYLDDPEAFAQKYAKQQSDALSELYEIETQGKAAQVQLTHITSELLQPST